MRLLPELSTFPALRLPLCEASAVALMDLLLGGGRECARANLADALSLDPALALWSAAQAADTRQSPLSPCGIGTGGEGSGLTPRNLVDLADWLAAHAGCVLRWPEQRNADAVGDCGRSAGDGSCGPAEAASAARMQSADAAATAVQVAAVAGRLAEARLFDVPADEAYLAGLLAAAGEAYLDATARQDFDLPSRHAANPEAVAACVALAQGIVRGEVARPPGLKVKRHLERLQREVRRRWLSEHPAADWLPALAARLSEIDLLRAARREELEAAKLASLAEFAAGAGHEINNPLAVISGRAQLLLRDEEDPERRRDLAVMHVQAMRVHEMIADLMLFARPPRPRPETVELAGLLAALAEEMAPDLASRETTLALSCPAALTIAVDRGQLLVALRAICDNGLFAIGRGGRLDIAAGQVGEEVRIVVRDDGPGIPAEVRPHLFDPYYSGRSSGRGLGMGLAKCWRIVNQHGGRIEVADRQPGAEFAIVLPARNDAPPVAGNEAQGRRRSSPA